jgi:osmotically-inducible protein OsmY
MMRFLAGWLVAALGLFCTGCPQMAIMTGATTAAGIVADDRSLDQQAVDLGLKADIEKALLNNSPDLAEGQRERLSPARDAHRGRADEPARWNAVRIAREATGGQMVYDDLEVAAGNTLVDTAEDAAINKTLGLNLLATDGIASQSFQHRVVNGTAFIMGQAHQENQIETARSVALQTPGVRRVVTHILLTG